MNEYLAKLIMQYKKSTGSKHHDLKSVEFLKDFFNWIGQNSMLGDDYKQLLEYLNLSPKFSVEIGKGKFDTLITSSKNGVILSSYADTIDKASGIIKFNPDLLSPERPNDIITLNKINSSFEGSTLTSQNPYSETFEPVWSNFHNNAGVKILVGVYGKTYDKDVLPKRKSIRDLGKTLNWQYIEEAFCNKENYFHFLATENKKRVRTKK